MPTVYPNSMSILQAREMMSAAEKGYLSTALWGQDLMALLPIVPPNSWMHDVQYKRVEPTEKRSSVRLINEEPDIKNSNRLTKDTELVAIYTTEATAIDKRVAEDKPEVMDMQMGWALKDLMRNINYDLVNSAPTSDGRGIKGLKARVPLGSAFDFNTVANGYSGAAVNVTTEAGCLELLRMFRSAHDEMHNTPGIKIVALTSRFIIQGISAGRDKLGADHVGGFGEDDLFGKRVTTIDNIPLLGMRGDSVGTEVFPFDEGGDSSASIILVAYDGSVNEDSEKIPEGAYILSTDQSDGGIIRKDFTTTLKQIVGSDELDIGLRTPKRSLARLSHLKTTA